MRAGFPFAVSLVLLALSFGVLAQDAGLSGFAAISMSALMFASAAQFAAVAILAGGGTAGAAVVAVALMNSRFLPMGAALAPSLPGTALRRAAQGQALVDSSWALAARGDGTFDRWLLFGSSAIQYVAWVGGTALAVTAGESIGDPRALGLDAIFPAFFVALLVNEARERRPRQVAALGALIALALVPVAPPGVPLLAAGLAALVGLRPATPSGGKASR